MISRTRGKIREPSVCVYSLFELENLMGIFLQNCNRQLFYRSPDVDCNVFFEKCRFVRRGCIHRNNVVDKTAESRYCAIGKRQMPTLRIAFTKRVNHLFFCSCVFCAVVFQWGDVTPQTRIQKILQILDFDSLRSSGKSDPRGTIEEKNLTPKSVRKIRFAFSLAHEHT